MEDIGSMLPGILQKHLRPGKGPVLEILAPLWPRAVGKYIGQFSKPVAFEDGRLILAVASPSWETQLRAMADPLRAQINGFLGSPIIETLRIRRHWAGDRMMAKLQAVIPAAAGHSDPWEITASAESAAAARLLHVEDSAKLPPELMNLVERSFVKYFSRRGVEREA